MHYTRALTSLKKEKKIERQVHGEEKRNENKINIITFTFREERFEIE